MINNLYIGLILTGFGIGALIIALVVLFLWMYILRNNNIKKKIDQIESKYKDTNEVIDGMNELFHTHFSVTDKTILDTRIERDYWKAEALKNEKKRGQK